MSDGNSELVAELVTANGFKAAYAIKDGAEGARGWMNSGLPWLLPKKSLSLDFGSWTEALYGSLPEGSEAFPVTLGLAAATGLGVLAFTEIETILQVLGSAAIIQVISKKLLFAEDRKQTLEQVDDFLNTKIAPKELFSELKEIGAALLPLPATSKALPAPTEASSEPETAPQKAESVSEQKLTEEKAEATPAPATGINSVPQTEAKVESRSGVQRPLSPYTMYPDLKPPSSPRPCQPSSAPAPPPPPTPTLTPAPAPIPETNSIPRTEAKAESHSGIDRPLSPYPLYPDLKPPSSPCPSQP